MSLIIELRLLLEEALTYPQGSPERIAITKRMAELLSGGRKEPVVRDWQKAAAGDKDDDA